MDKDTNHDNHLDIYKNMPMQGFYFRFFDLKKSGELFQKLSKIGQIYTAEKKSKNFPNFLLENDNFCQNKRNCAHGRKF
jgi:hypothetical protein